MKAFKMFVIAICLATACVFVLPRTYSGGWFSKTKLMLSGPAQSTPEVDVEPTNHFPRTAGSISGFLIFGSLCLILGIGLRKFSKRDASRSATEELVKQSE